MTRHLNTEDEDAFARKSAVRGGEQTRPQRSQERVGEKHSSRRERQSGPGGHGSKVARDAAQGGQGLEQVARMPSCRVCRVSQEPGGDAEG